MFSLHTIQSANADNLDIDVGKAPIFIELFTSQGCSSCPPAEKILGQLSNHRRIFTLSCHVTYWDYLGWTDTFAIPDCDKRQRNIMRTRGNKNYYTPQMVVNGADEFPGHRSGRIKKAIEKANKSPAAIISMSHQDTSVAIAMLPNVIKDDYSLWVFGYRKPREVRVGNGENRGRKLISTNTVATISDLGSWDGKAGMKRFTIDGGSNIDGIVLIAQKDKYGPIVATGRIEF